MNTTPWKRLLAQSIHTADQLHNFFGDPVCEPEIAAVAGQYPLLINPYYLGLIKKAGDPLWRQAVPSGAELMDAEGMDDPLAEEQFSPVCNITHRYPDRVLFLVSNRCALYCRFCTRKRKIGKGFPVNEKTIAEGICYIKEQTKVRDVLVSGGDPLLLDDEELADILHGLRAIEHVEIIRIGTRVPCVLPQRITGKLARTIQRFHPVYINTHFNHPDEITPEAVRACGMLSDAGIPLGCQTVLLKGINDSSPVMRQLMNRLLRIRVRPYYIHHADLTRGTNHFRTSIKTGLDIMRALRGNTSGMCVPHYVIDLPGGGGKVPLTPQYIMGVRRQELVIKNYRGELFSYKISPEDVPVLSPKNLL